MPTNSAFQTKLIFILLVIIIFILSTVKNDNIIGFLYQAHPPLPPHHYHSHYIYCQKNDNVVGFLYYAHPPLPPYTSPNLHPPPQCRWVLVSRVSKYLHHINCGVIQGFPALRKAVTTHVKKYRIFSRVLLQPISCWHVTRLWRHSVRLMNEQQSLHDSQYKVLYRNFLGLWRLKH